MHIYIYININIYIYIFILVYICGRLEPKRAKRRSSTVEPALEPALDPPPEADARNGAPGPALPGGHTEPTGAGVIGTNSPHAGHASGVPAGGSCTTSMMRWTTSSSVATSSCNSICCDDCDDELPRSMVLFF